MKGIDSFPRLKNLLMADVFVSVQTCVIFKYVLVLFEAKNKTFCDLYKLLNLIYF